MFTTITTIWRPGLRLICLLYYFITWYEGVFLLDDTNSTLSCPSNNFVRHLMDFKPGLHISRKDRKHMVASTFFSFPGIPWSSHSCDDLRYSYLTRNICKRYINSFKTLSEHDRKDVLRLSRLYGDQALDSVIQKLQSNGLLALCW